MRHIKFDIDKLEISEEWKKKARVLTDQLIAENDSATRKAIISANTDMWREVKIKLAELSFGKCWYSESKQDGTDTDVDHFRPKNKVHEDTNSEGYWWLSFEISNYRFSCIYSNRRRSDGITGTVGGKSDYFPLCNPVQRALTPTCDLDNELPELLDPCDDVDVTFLNFAENGEALPRFDSKDRLRPNIRAARSIELYNLNNSSFKSARIELRDKLNFQRSNLIKNFKKLDSGDAAHKEAFKQTVIEIKGYLAPEQPYSSFCKAYLNIYRHEAHFAGIL